MMRYQRVSPDCLALPNGRKPTSISSSFYDDKPIKIRSGSGSGGSTNPTTAQTQQQDTVSHFPHFPSISYNTNHEIGGGNGRCSTTTTGDVLLQWGHKKRSRGSRAENPNRTVGDESSAVQSRQMVKIQRRAAIAGAEKIAAVAAASSAAMPPPRGAALRAFTTGPHHNINRNVEDRSGGQSRSDKRFPPSPPIKPHNNHLHNNNHKKKALSANGFRSDGAASMNLGESKPSPSDQETRGGGPSAGPAGEKVNLEHFEWPKIYISLSRKEKEDDFLAMKGTKLPQRPKKRAKNVDKTLQYCFPGMWLSDLTRGRYEVREKKCVKKKRRGLKGMESMDSDSD